MLASPIAKPFPKFTQPVNWRLVERGTLSLTFPRYFFPQTESVLKGYNSPHYSLQLVSQKQSKPTLLNKTKSYNYQFNCLRTWTALQHKQTHNSAKTHQTLQQPHPLEFNQATPNAYQMIALCLCNNMTPSQTQLLLTLRETLSFERRVSPGTKTQNSHTLEQSIVFRTTPPSSLEFNQATPNSYQMIALYLYNNTTPR